MNDPKFTEKLKKWFDSEHTDANIREGALLLLQMNNNRHLYQLINFDPQGKLEMLKYELQKHLKYRIEGMTIDDVRNYDKAVTPVLQTAIDKTSEADQIAKQLAPHLPVVESENLDSIVPSAIVAKGKRADHDQLPDNIQAIWENNCDLWKKIKEHFEACKAYDMSCDRYEGLHAADEDFKRMLLTLKEEYYAYKQAMDVYDHAQPGDAEEKQAEEQPVADIISKQIGNARSYITKNLNQLIGFVEAGNTDKADALRAKVNERVQLLITAKAEITADTIAKLQQSSSQVFLGQGLHTLGLLGWILEQTGAAHIAVTTFSTSDAFLCGVINLRKRGLVDSSVLVADIKASSKTLKLSRLMTEAFDEVKLTLNHSKVMLVANNEWLVSVITSQNQTYGDRAECTFITTDRDVYLNLNNMLNNLLDDTTTIPLSGRE